MVLFFLGCLGLFFLFPHRFLVFIARLGVLHRPLGGVRLLPLGLSLCFPLRGVGFIIVLRCSSPFFLYVVGLRPPMLVNSQVTLKKGLKWPLMCLS